MCSHVAKPFCTLYLTGEIYNQGGSIVSVKTEIVHHQPRKMLGSQVCYVVILFVNFQFQFLVSPKLPVANLNIYDLTSCLSSS